MRCGRWSHSIKKTLRQEIAAEFFLRLTMRERIKAVLLLSINVLVWLLLLIVSLPIIVFRLVKRIFVKPK